MKIVTAIFLFTAALIASCSQGYIVNLNEKTNFPEGRELFLSKCSSCHNLYNPNNYTEAEWNPILVKMKKKAKISEEQKNEIYKWILERKKIDLTRKGTQ